MGVENTHETCILIHARLIIMLVPVEFRREVKFLNTDRNQILLSGNATVSYFKKQKQRNSFKKPGFRDSWCAVPLGSVFILFAVSFLIVEAWILCRAASGQQYHGQQNRPQAQVWSSAQYFILLDSFDFHYSNKFRYLIVINYSLFFKKFICYKKQTWSVVFRSQAAAGSVLCEQSLTETVKRLECLSRPELQVRRLQVSVLTNRYK